MCCLLIDFVFFWRLCTAHSCAASASAFCSHTFCAAKLLLFFWNMQVRARFFLKNVFFVQQKLHIWKKYSIFVPDFPFHFILLDISRVGSQIRLV